MGAIPRQEHPARSKVVPSTEEGAEHIASSLPSRNADDALQLLLPNRKGVPVPKPDHDMHEATRVRVQTQSQSQSHRDPNTLLQASARWEVSFR